MGQNHRALTARACALAVALAAMIPATAEARYAGRTLKVGSHGRDVRLFQKYLTKAGFRTTADGQYGRRTRLHEKRFERRAHRHVDGRASRADQRAVRKEGGGTAARGADTPPNSARAVITQDGRTAVAPESAPAPVKRAIAAANRITRRRYRYGGGHGRWEDSGYDCSGAVSYAMHGGGLLNSPLASTGFESWGSAGRGRWITVYANSGHAYTVIAGLRFDTSSAGAGGGSGPRWRDKPRSGRGYVARHPAGL
jgi:hypothetical protein